MTKKLFTVLFSCRFRALRRLAIVPKPGRRGMTLQRVTFGRPRANAACGGKCRLEHGQEDDMSERVETVTLGGGCFWCTEAVYERVRGVKAVESGYSNGHVDRPSYEQVCGGDTGHAEVVRVSFDPEQITLREILEIFFVVHDPTQLNRQGNDTGTQYRSGIYFHSPEQEKVAREVLAEVDELHRGRAVTEVLPETNYSRAEAYHQHYLANHPNQGYCAMVVAPKVEKFRKTFGAKVAA
jgi:peptide-methionine (S)-S-oxide reductase